MYVINEKKKQTPHVYNNYDNDLFQTTTILYLLFDLIQENLY